MINSEDDFFNESSMMLDMEEAGFLVSECD